MRKTVTLLLIRTKNAFIQKRIKAIELSILMKYAAKAFDVSRPKGHTLEAFAAFTKEASVHGKPDRMYDVFYQLGRKVKKISGLTDPKDLEELIFFLYKNIDIEMHGSFENEVWIAPCYFSRHYTLAQCIMMSNMDSGIVTGIYGGKRLTFTKRITEGCACCKAFIERNER